MALADVKCAECSARLKISEQLVGTKIKCPKCRETFFAEVGDSYGLAADPVPTRTQAPKHDGVSPPAPAKGKAKSAKSAKPAKPAKPETAAERAQRERLEKWAKSME